MSEALNILQKYWKHKEFRPLQEDIISSIIEDNDTLAILPTGGGKSVCYQIPAIMKEGICLVISPLVALIKDQVENLQKRNIKAIALTGGIHKDEISNLLDNCLYGNYKFLYLSPERLQSDWIVERIKELPVNLIAIDEAHCVSQWGHDFRPAYLKISMLKKFFPKVPFIGLTATATQIVKEDIVKQLQLNNHNEFKQSFYRSNIAYMVFKVEDKLHLAGQILKKNPQSSIIYVRNRKSCLDISAQINTLGFKSTYYHGGLDRKLKEKHMQLWMSGDVQVIVATNAFGMGIDKADVKTILHWQLPENIENYYQEAGRAGRNGQKSFAVILLSPSDFIQTRTQFIDILPDKDFLKTVFVKLCNYFQIAFGEGIDQQFSFNLNHFCVHYNFSLLKTYNALQFLDRQGVLTLSKEFSEKISIQILISSKEIMRYMSINREDEEIILTILRTYPGIYEVVTPVNLSLIAKKTKTSENNVLRLFEKLKNKSIIDLYAKKNDATIIFNEIREDERTINRVSKYLEIQNKQKKEQLDAVFEYVENENSCKSNLILKYFGEIKAENCGICSYCISKNNKVSDKKHLAEMILEILQKENLTSREIQIRCKYPIEEVIFVLENLLDSNLIGLTSNNSYTIYKK